MWDAGTGRAGHTWRVIPWDEKWPQLRYGEVFPLPLASETCWSNDGCEVAIQMMTSANDAGHSAVPIWTYRAPYAPGKGASNEEAAEVTTAVLTEFALKLRRLLSD